MNKEEVIEEAQKPVAPIDLSAIKNLDVAGDRDESLKEIKSKANTMKKNKGKFCFMEAHRIPLLSGGRYYQDSNDKDLKDGYIKLVPMSLAEEEILTNQAYLKNNSAFRLVFDNCLRSDYKASNLLSYDVYYLLYALRNISYGNDYEFNCKCAECGKEFKKTINIDEIDWEEIPEDVQDEVVVNLPVSRYTVKIRMSRLKDEEEVTRLSTVKKYEEVPERILEYFVRTIEIIDDNGEPVAPSDWIEFYQALPTKDRVAIADKFNYASNVPTVQIICPKCSATREVGIPIDKGFFRLS